MGLEKTVVEAFELGADDFITKPFNPNELIVRVQRFMPKG
jgi:DNA-binding response OmpR family regulator